MAKSSGGAPYFLMFACSITLAILFTLIPVDPAYSICKPQFLFLIVVYWGIYRPFNFGIGYAWAAGLIADIVFAQVWGGYATALALTAYLCATTYQRLSHYHFWQQAIWVAIFCLAYHAVLVWFQSLRGYGLPFLSVLINALITAACWPLIFILLNRFSRLYRAG